MIIGVTGSLATGKSTVAKYLASSLKGHLIDADKIAHMALGKKSPVYKDVIKSFGKDILDKEGKIVRKRLALKVFTRSSSLNRLDKLIHPFVISKIKGCIEDIYQLDKNAFIILDAPVLIESGLHRICDLLIVVIANLSLQLERSRRFKNLDYDDSLSRIKSQMPLYKKALYADYIIDNSSSLKELEENVKRLTAKMKGI